MSITLLTRENCFRCCLLCLDSRVIATVLVAMRNTPSNRLFLPALVLSQCLVSTLSWQGQSSSNLFSPRSSFSPLQKSASSSRFLRIQHPRRRSSQLNGDDGEGHTADGPSIASNFEALESQESTATPSTLTADVIPAEEFIRLQKENEQLRESLRQMEIENSRLLHDAPSRIILETFEGERKIRRAESIDDPSMWCDELEDDACPVEPMISFSEALRDRAYWLVGLLILQSGSGIILARNEALLANHPVSKFLLAVGAVPSRTTPSSQVCAYISHLSLVTCLLVSHLLSHHAGRSWRKRGQPSERPSDSRLGPGNAQRKHTDAVFDARTENGRRLVWYSLCHGICAGACLSNAAGRDDCHYGGVGLDCLHQYLFGSHLASDTETRGC
jgi:hypothetical protein